MTETADKALLPAGLRDILPPDAAAEADIIERLMAHFSVNGFERVKPPLVEFEESLLAGPGAAMAPHTFRIMDPLSQRMMGVRADMTLQVARIARTRLGRRPRPLRLCYAGQVLRVKGSQLRPQRQFAQAGFELIGSDSPAADAEAVLLAVEALERLGLKGLSVDLTLPPLVPALCRGLRPEVMGPLRHALDHKDTAVVAQSGVPMARTLDALIKAAGPADRAIRHMNALDLDGEAAAARDRLAEVAARVRGEAPALQLTVDPVENRGYEYHTGVSFSFFAKGLRGELGRGGRYRASNGAGEPATGATLFIDVVRMALPATSPPARLFVPMGVDRARLRTLQDEGWTTVQGLDDVADPRREAARLKCSHVWLDEAVRPLDET